KENRTRIIKISQQVDSLLNRASWEALKPFESFLICSESTASSRVEGIGTNRKDFAKAVLMFKASDNAKLTLSGIEATTFLARAIHQKREVREEDILKAHYKLLRVDPVDSSYAGQYRTKQNWIGGGDTPRNALYVPPTERLIPELMADLVNFCNRDDFNPITQAIIAHAQFESIHPFIDGNGRIGRALITGLLNKTNPHHEALILPFSSAMLANVEKYYAALTSYREGNIDAVIDYFTESFLKVIPAVDAALVRLAELPDEFKERIKPRAGSALSRFLEELPKYPIFDADGAQKMLRISYINNVYREMEKLVDKGILEPVSTAKRKRSWLVPAVFDEMERMQEDIGARKIFDA
ncbi:MAG: Fic family protein, partial [Micrococcaceae bacterium]